MPEAGIWAAVVLNAMEHIRGGIEPVESYQNTVRHLLPHSKSMQMKSEPRHAFLGLCGDGYVTGVVRGSYTRSNQSASAAVDAVRILISSPTLGRLDNIRLWNEVQKVNAEARKRLNGSQGEMTVVRTLWDNGYINP